MKTITTKCKVGSVEQTQAQIDEAKHLTAKNQINTETQKKIYTLLGVDSADKAKEVQMNANNEATDILADVMLGIELSDERQNRLIEIQAGAQKIKQILAEGQAKKATL